jgi:hypothetical protein
MHSQSMYTETVFEGMAVSLIQEIVSREPEAIQEEVFPRTFDSLYKRCKHCAEAVAGGDYIK